MHTAVRTKFVFLIFFNSMFLIFLTISYNRTGTHAHPHVAHPTPGGGYAVDRPVYGNYRQARIVPHQRERSPKPARVVACPTTSVC